MNTVNYNEKGAIADATYVGVDNNRLVVTNRPVDFGTFVVTTNDEYVTIPYHKGYSFRINNSTGKFVGIRRRHIRKVVDNLDDLNYSEWQGSGSITQGEVLEGVRGALITGMKYREITNEVMNNGSEVEVTFKTPNRSTYSIEIAVWDSSARITTGNSAAIFTGTDANTVRETEYKVIFRLRKDDGKSDVFLEGPQGREDISMDVAGEFGTSDMANSIVSVEASESTVVDPIVYQQKVQHTHEIMPSISSFSFPCVDNISEYEVINLGSDPMNYSDNTDSISLTGFYAT